MALTKSEKRIVRAVIAAVVEVEKCWEHGDLAGAINELSEAALDLETLVQKPKKKGAQ